MKEIDVCILRVFLLLFERKTSIKFVFIGLVCHLKPSVLSLQFHFYTFALESDSKHIEIVTDSFIQKGHVTDLISICNP